VLIRQQKNIFVKHQKAIKNAEFYAVLKSGEKFEQNATQQILWPN
jgi:hypothetical protein